MLLFMFESQEIPSINLFSQEFNQTVYILCLGLNQYSQDSNRTIY